MASNEGLSDLDLELLGEEPSTPAHANEHPVTSPDPVNSSDPVDSPDPAKASDAKAPAQAGFTPKSRPSSSSNPIHVFGTSAATPSDFTQNFDTPLGDYSSIKSPEVPFGAQTGTGPTSSENRSIFTPQLVHNTAVSASPSSSGHPSIFAQSTAASTTPQSSEHRSIFFQNPTAGAAPSSSGPSSFAQNAVAGVTPPWNNPGSIFFQNPTAGATPQPSEHRSNLFQNPTAGTTPSSSGPSTFAQNLAAQNAAAGVTPPWNDPSSIFFQNPTAGATPQASEHHSLLFQNPTTGAIPQPSEFPPLFSAESIKRYTMETSSSSSGPLPTPKTPQNFTPNSQQPSDKSSSTSSQPSGSRVINMPKGIRKPSTSVQALSEKSDPIDTDLEDISGTNNTLNPRDVVKLMRKCGRLEKNNDNIKTQLSSSENEVSELKNKLFNSKEDLKDTNKKLDSTESELAESTAKCSKAEEALRAKVERAVRDGRRFQDTENALEQLRKEHEGLLAIHTVVQHKNKTQTSQVSGSEIKVRELRQELADYKTRAEEKEARLQRSITNLTEGVEQSRKLIQSSGIEQRRAEIDSFSAHVDAFDESREDWIRTQNLLEDDLALIKLKLEEKERVISTNETEIKKLKQSNNDFKRVNQKLKSQQETNTSSSTSNNQVSYKQSVRIDYSTDEDQGSSNGKPQHSLGTELYRDAGVQSTDDEVSEAEEKTITFRDIKPTSTSDGSTRTEKDETIESRDLKPTSTSDGSTRTEKDETIESRDLKPTSTIDGSTRTEEDDTITFRDAKSTSTSDSFTQTEEVEAQLPKLEKSPIYTIDTAPVVPTASPWSAPKLGLSPIYTINSAPVPKAATQTVQTEPFGAEGDSIPKAIYTSQGVQTEPMAAEGDSIPAVIYATQGTQTEPIAAEVESIPRPTYASQGVQTESMVAEATGEKPWFMRNLSKNILGSLLALAVFLLLLWVWVQGNAAKKERKMWTLANDHAYRLSDEVIRKQAIALLLRTQDRSRLGWLSPERVMTLHRGAHQAFARAFLPLVAPTRSISTASVVQSAMAPTPEATVLGTWPAWGEARW